ncbi:thiamine-phosphate kinase [Ereboglobus luteus]|uniref:Thiamine-monophosphate kinase n=1 Tax=Ereboglobus luteus TaxID=1796921 RepID=A0A2U8E6B4_9BACT|nr:thiamine-phosphate kinase [Ereboglobus luteus]AWI10360.1 thiamine-phosphate kinase [Ereboglobus luteus]
MHPFSSKPGETVSALGEEKLITRIRRWLGPVSPPAPLGIGDDCAVLAPSKRAQAVTVDPVIYGRHFDDAVPPRAVGAKLLKRNLSDLAAMGAAPVAAVLAITLDPGVRIAWLEQFYRGLASCARAYRLRVIGGDIAQNTGALAASLTLIGRATTPRMLLRTGARAGDHIYTTGTLGGSLLGKHYRFTPRLAEGAWLAARAEVRSMMDISDGIAKDLHSLTPAGARAEIDATAIPISAAAKKMARGDNRPPLVHALCDGEDYELLFTVAAKTNLPAFDKKWRARFPKTPLARIGRFVPLHAPRAPGAIDLAAHHGYEHLAIAR